MRYRYLTADVFTSRPFGGNPLAVFPHAEGLSEGQMQIMAAELNLSETVFVFAPEDGESARRLRIFTPKTELPFAGHPTVGAAYVLARTGELALRGERTRLVFEEGVGPVKVSVLARDGRVASARLTAAKPPEYGPEPPPGRRSPQSSPSTSGTCSAAHTPRRPSRAGCPSSSCPYAAARPCAGPG